MKIKTLLIVCSIGLIGFSSFVAAIVYTATLQIDRVTAQGAHATNVMAQVFELNSLTQDYLRSLAERPKVQWNAEYARIDKMLDDPILQQEPSKNFLALLQKDMEGLKSAFDQIVSLSDTAGADQKLIEQVSGDFLVKTRHMTQIADQMADAAAAQRTSLRARNDRMVLLMLAFLAVVANAVIWLLYHRIINPISKLQEGTDIVAKGDLQHKVQNDAPDEIGQLSRAFDHMTAELNKSYETLEEKVKERTKELQELTQKNELMLQSIGDGVIAIDTAWKVILWNDAAEHITGFSSKEAIGKPLRDVLRFIREHDRSENVQFISDAMLTGKVRFMENHTLVIRKDGTEVPVGDSAAPIFDAQDKVTGVIIVFRDTTTDREAQLIRSSFAYASHQLRTPVTEALWSIELARDEAKSAATKAQIEVALNSMKSVRKLVNALMEVSEIDQKTVVPHLKKTDLKAVLQEVQKLTTDRLNQQDVVLRIGKLAVAKGLKTDPTLLTRAIYEIVDNAIAYSKPKSRVTVNASVHEGQLLIEIQDAGIGILSEQEGIIFTKFFRGANIPEGSVGAGLGLYISREYLKLLKGKIWFKSRQNQGTSFFISLPLEEKESA